MIGFGKPHILFPNLSIRVHRVRNLRTCEKDVGDHGNARI
jgi:hypothetical protein